MTISSQIFEAYLKCSTKCWLRSRSEPGAGTIYSDWTRAQNEIQHENGLRRLLAIFPKKDRAIAPTISENPKDWTWRLATDVHIRANDLESRLQAIERGALETERRGRAQLIPYRFEFANSLTKEHKLLLAFDALLLSEAARCEVRLGKIVHGNAHGTTKVKISVLASEVRKQIKDITALVVKNSPPDLVLNRHCSQCEFQARCGRQAMDKDDLSLLSGMSDKERRKLNAKGIFTVTQLSYTFRPRRRRRQATIKHEKYHHSLKALANPRE